MCRVQRTREATGLRAAGCGNDVSVVLYQYQLLVSTKMSRGEIIDILGLWSVGVKCEVWSVERGAWSVKQEGDLIQPWALGRQWQFLISRPCSPFWLARGSQSCLHQRVSSPLSLTVSLSPAHDSSAAHRVAWDNAACRVIRSNQIAAPQPSQPSPPSPNCAVPSCSH